MTLLLASASPRRADLLRTAGFDIEVWAANVDERQLPGESPAAHVARLAEAKAAAVSAASNHVVVAADTVVVIDGEVLGKPKDDEDAARMLRLLSGRRHDVLTGVSVGGLTRVEATAVEFLPLSDREIAWYVKTGEPRDKAGAYAVQGLASRFVARIEGSYTNVVGLPIATVCAMLKELGRGETGPAVFDPPLPSGYS